MTIGDRIKKLRTEKGLTQEELGVMIGVQKQAIYKYEQGLVVNLKRDTIAKLAQVFNVSPSYLMWGEKNDDLDKKNQNSNNLSNASSESRLKLRSIARLEDSQITPEQDLEISNYIDYLLSKRGKE